MPKPKTTKSNPASSASKSARELDMLVALTEIESLLDGGNIDQSHWDDCLGIARRAIAQATGYADAAESPHEIQIHLERGVIHDIRNIPPGTAIKVLDYDTDGITEEDHTIENTPNGRAVISYYTPD